MNINQQCYFISSKVCPKKDFFQLMDDFRMDNVSFRTQKDAIVALKDAKKTLLLVKLNYLVEF